MKTLLQAGRELDAKVALALGWTFTEENMFIITPQSMVDNKVPDFSTTWEGLGALMTEAVKRRIHIDIMPRDNGYIAVWGRSWSDHVMSKQAPYAVAFGFLRAATSRENIK